MSTIRIYSASAGSGKTFTLVKEYLKILLTAASGGNFFAFRNILAITFTNKATEEMKQRVIGTLKDIAAGKENKMLNVISNELPELKGFSVLADKILVRILHDFSNFNILTIDSFFQDIIRSFARELELPLNYEIELDTEKGLEYAADEVIGSIGFDDQVTKWLESYALSLMHQDKNWNFRSHLLKISREVFDDKIDLEALGEQASAIPGIKVELLRIVRSVEEGAADTAGQVLQFIEQSGIPEEAFSKAWLTNLRKTQNRLKGLTIPIVKTYREQLAEERSPFLKASLDKYAAEITLLEASGYRESLGRLHELLTSQMAVSLAAKEAMFNIYALGVIDRINDKLKKYRIDNNLLFIVDAARLIQGFIRLSDMPFLFEKTGSRIKYLFVDEFQDTSVMQWENILPVLQNILSSATNAMTVMLVGDAKQSIYRWRGGDYRLITGQAAASLQPFKSETLDLDTNFRSLPEVIRFNNSFFNTVKEMSGNFGNNSLQEEISAAYRSVEQSGKTSPWPGHVRVEIIPKDTEAHWKSEALSRLDEQLKRLKEAGYRYDEMAILVNRRSEGVEISRHLQRAGIEVLSGETLLLKFDPDVRLLLAGLYYVVRPDIPLYYVNLLWHYSIRKGLDQIPGSDILQDHGKKLLLQQWIPSLGGDLSIIRNLSSYQLVEFLIEELGITDGENLFVSHFRQMAFEFFKRESTEAADLIEWWEENRDKASVSLDEGKGRVHVVTIHKSKGLEFPVVLIPFCEWNIYQKLHETMMWLSDDRLLNGSQLPVRATSAVENSIFGEAVTEEKKFRWIDSLNVMYVAFTRAREVLYISAPEASLKQEEPTTVSQLLCGVMKEWDALEYLCWEGGQLEKPEREYEDPGPEDARKTVAHDKSRPFGIQLSSGFDSEQTSIGKLVHMTMQFYGEMGPEAALRQALRSGDFTDMEIEASKKHIEAIQQMETVREWIDSAQQTWSEQDLWHDGQLLRPDKVLRLNGRLIILDFKTGEPDDAYAHKMHSYKEAIRHIFPLERVEGYIVYTANAELVEA